GIVVPINVSDWQIRNARAMRYCGDAARSDAGYFSRNHGRGDSTATATALRPLTQQTLFS
ncbi:MAG: hypothetical protein ACKV2V_22300, partial [Blastocatellia bacterium]